jgi:hypothetical protein
MKIKIVSAFTLFVMLCASVWADEEVGNSSIVRSSEYGRFYAKSVPDESYGQKGTTKMFSVGKDTDTLVCEYKWYANEIYIGGNGDMTVIRFGPWQRGSKPEPNHFAIGIYRDGKVIREYSTLEMMSLGSEVSKTVSHYDVFTQPRHLGFRWVKENIYQFEVEGVSGKLFTFDLDNGAIIDKNIKLKAVGFENIKFRNMVVNSLSGDILADSNDWIYLKDKTTKEWKKLIPGCCPQWCPDGKKFYYFLDVGYDGNRTELWQANTNGEDRIRLTQSDYFIYESPVVSKDGKKLAYYYRTGRASGEVGQIIVIELNGVDNTAEANVVFKTQEDIDSKSLKWIESEKLSVIINGNPIEINTAGKGEKQIL